MKEKWPDMEEVIQLCDEERVFLGSRPHDPVTFRNRYILAAGISLSAFARNRNGDCVEHTKGRLKSHWIGSEQRRRRLLPSTPLAIIFHKQASSIEGQISCLCSEVQDLLVKFKSKGGRKSLKPLQYLEQFSQTIAQEAKKTHFHFLHMDTLCQTLLTGLSILDTRAGLDFEGPGAHASLVYDLLYSAYHACQSTTRTSLPWNRQVADLNLGPTCRNVSGDKTIMPMAADLIGKIAAGIGNDISTSASASFALRFETTSATRDPCNKQVEPERECGFGSDRSNMENDSDGLSELN